MPAIEMQPLNRTIYREILFGPTVVLLVFAMSNRVSACLRASIDDRAIQWASAIVEAKLTHVSDALDLGLEPAESYRLDTFEVSTAFDRTRKAGDKSQVLRPDG